MSHKKGNSRIHVPFSWEKMPGVPKFMASPMCALVPSLAGNNREVLPLPPAGSFRQLPVIRRSASKRMVFRGKDEDPFHAAIIECTKDCDHDDNIIKAKEDIKMNFGRIPIRRVRMRKCFLSSCKRSFDIEEGSFMLLKPSSLGCILRKDRD